MTRYVFKMPDLGEGTVEAEVVAWHIKVGDMVQEDQVMAEVMTDKAAVEVPAPVSGKVVTINGQPGDMVRVGSELVVFETEAADDDVVPAPSPAAAGEGGGEGPQDSDPHHAPRATSPAQAGEVKEAEPSPGLRPTSPADAGELAVASRRRRPRAAKHARRASTCGRSRAPVRAAASCRRISLPR